MLAGLVNSTYCPPQHLSAVFSNVGRQIQRHILVKSEAMTWKTKINKEHFTILKKLAKLFFLIQHLSVPRFIMTNEKLSNLDVYLIAFSDANE